MTKFHVITLILVVLHVVIACPSIVAIPPPNESILMWSMVCNKLPLGIKLGVRIFHELLAFLRVAHMHMLHLHSLVHQFVQKDTHKLNEVIIVVIKFDREYLLNSYVANTTASWDNLHPTYH